MFTRSIQISTLRRRVEDVACELMDRGMPTPPETCGPGWVYDLGHHGFFHIMDAGPARALLLWGDDRIMDELEWVEQHLTARVRQAHQDAADDFNEGDPGLPPLTEPAWYAVCVALRDKAYGGPEEGGWWYDTTQPNLDGDFPMPVIVRTRDEAEAEADKMADWCTAQNEGRPSISSVLSQGVYVPMIYEGVWPHHLPTEVPHYE